MTLDPSLNVLSDLNLSLETIRGLRTDRYLLEARSDNYLTMLENPFAREWLAEIFMTAVVHEAIKSNSSIEEAVNTVRTGNSDLPDLKQEFNNLPHVRGTLSMARTSDPNSANSQFFICFNDKASHLDRQYTVFGKVIEGMEFVDKIKRGEPAPDPDKIISFRSK